MKVPESPHIVRIMLLHELSVEVWAYIMHVDMELYSTRP
jgi:hypothetical protein